MSQILLTRLCVCLFVVCPLLRLLVRLLATSVHAHTRLPARPSAARSLARALFAAALWPTTTDGKSSVKKDLLEWCNRALNPQGVFVKDFTGDWQDAAAFSGLVNYCRGEPDIDLSKLDRTSNGGRLEGLDTSFNKAEEYFGFPRLLDAQDVVEVLFFSFQQKKCVYHYYFYMLTNNTHS